MSNKNLRHSALFAGLALTLACGAASAVPLVNADFEAVQLGSPYFSNNAANVPGWTHSGAYGNAFLWGVGYADLQGSATKAGSGNQFVTLGSGFQNPPAFSAWSQTVSGLTIGETYTLTFMLAAETAESFPTPLNIQVDFPTGSAQAAQVFVPAPAGANYWSNWSTDKMTFIANSTTAELRFSTVGSGDIGLDNVQLLSSVEAANVPEPGTLTLMMLSAAGLAAFSRRARR